MKSTRFISVQPYLQPLTDALQQFEGSRAEDDVLQTGLFADILSQLTRNRVGTQWRTLSYLWDRYEAGLKHSREGKLASAELVFSDMATLRDQLQADPLLTRLIDVAGLPAIAYLRYKQARYDEAESLLMASIDSDAELLPEGFFVLEYHRVQQLHNLARLYFRQGRLEDGARMIASALQFIVYGHKPAVGSGKGWLEHNTEKIPAQLCSDMLFQLTNETVELFLMHPDQNDELCRIAFSNLTFWEPRTADEVQLLDWFTLKECYYTGQVDEFITGSVQFLTRSPVHFDHCKLAILVNLVACLDQADHYTSTTHQVVNAFIQKLKVRHQQRETCSLLLSRMLGNEDE